MKIDHSNVKMKRDSCVINPKHKENSNYKKIKNRSICIYGLISSNFFSSGLTH